MSQNYSEVQLGSVDSLPKAAIKRRWWMVIVLPAWVFISFFVAQSMVFGLIWLLLAIKVPIKSINQTVLSALIAGIVYMITLAIVVVIPWVVKRYRTSKIDIGLTRLPRWTDILITPAGLISYLIISSVLILLATQLLPWFDVNQVQETGFNQINQRFELILAFITLVVIAPVAEEILFRGYLYGKLKKYVPIWVAILATSLLFGAIHGAWNLAIDTFVLSIILCLLRESTGSIWSSILLHMAKNGIAFFILFIYPLLFTTLGR